MIYANVCHLIGTHYWLFENKNKNWLPRAIKKHIVECIKQKKTQLKFWAMFCFVGNNTKRHASPMAMQTISKWYWC